MKFGIVTFPGSNGDYDALHAITEQLGEEGVYLWHKDHDLRGVDVIILPGGFSYGDYLRAGAIARFSPIMHEVMHHAKRGGPVLAICNGFQSACEAGLLPGALLRNASLKFVSRTVTIRVESTDTVFTSEYHAGDVLHIPVAHGDGRYVADPETLRTLEDTGRVVFRYTTPDGERDTSANPNGSMNDIAGIASEAGNIVGMMPHPERAVDAMLGSKDGLAIFESVLATVGA